MFIQRKWFWFPCIHELNFVIQLIELFIEDNVQIIWKRASSRKFELFRNHKAIESAFKNVEDLLTSYQYFWDFSLLSKS